MTWRFDVIATVQERLLSRILQVLEVQRVTIHSFTGKMEGTEARVDFVVSSEEDKAYRIEALLHRLEGVYEISVSPVSECATNCVAIVAKSEPVLDNEIS
jgi:acetolactate synthase regulatory subunit